MMKTERTDIYEQVTSEIIAAMENGCGAWRMPWHLDDSANTFPINAVSGVAYRGVNILALWARAMKRGYLHGVLLYARTYHVFNVSQVDGYEIPKREESTEDRMDSAEKFFSSLGVTVREASKAQLVVDWMYDRILAQ